MREHTHWPSEIRDGHATHRCTMVAWPLSDNEREHDLGGVAADCRASRTRFAFLISCYQTLNPACDSHTL